MVYCVSASTVDVETDKFPKTSTHPWLATPPPKHFEPWMLDCYLSRAELADYEPLTDVVTIGAYGVCTAIRDIIERMEPGVNQFKPFDLVHRGKTYRYHCLIIRQEIDCVDTDRSQLDWMVTIHGDRVWMKLPGTPFAIKSELVRGCHVWNPKHTPHILISTELHDALQAAGLGSGWRYEKQIEV